MFASLLAPIAALIAGFDPATILAPAVSIPIWDQYVDLLEWALDGLADTLKSGGLAIIVFTIFIKTVLLPLTVQSLRSSKAMQELQPKIKELQKKHGKDRQRLTQETMRLYSEHHVNPMAGCLPMLLQIPIFLGLYNAIRHLSGGDGSSEYWEGSFLWLSNGLNQADPFFILPIAAGVFQFIQTRMMRPRNQEKITDPQQAMMNTMMNFMPLTVVIFGWQFASGAVLYWATQSIYSVIQQWFITGWGSLGNWFPWLPELPEHRRLGYRPPRPKKDPVVVSGDEKYPVRLPGAMGWFQSRMEQAAETQRARRLATAGDGATGDSAGSNQARADAESVAIAAGSRPRSGASRGGGSGAKRGKASGAARNRNRSGAAAKANVSNGATADTGDEASEPAPAERSSRAVVVPRKQRPTSNGS